jgi:hypothetical protein
VEYRVSIAGRNLKDLRIILPERREVFPEAEGPDKKAAVKEGPSGEGDPARHVPLYRINSARREEHSENDLSRVTVVMNISCFRTGTYSLPEIEILDAQNVRTGYKIPAITVAETNREGRLQEIEAPLEGEGNYTRLALLLLAAACLTLAGFFGFRYWRKRRENRAPQAVVLSPLEAFMRDAASLNGPDLIREGRAEEYILGISAVFRRFLSALYGLDAAEMTTEEIRSGLSAIFRSRNIPQRLDDVMAPFNLWDLAKFAEFMPSRETLVAVHDDIITLARRLAGESERQDGI